MKRLYILLALLFFAAPTFGQEGTPEEPECGECVPSNVTWINHSMVQTVGGVSIWVFVQDESESTCYETGSDADEDSCKLCEPYQVDSQGYPSTFGCTMDMDVEIGWDHIPLFKTILDPTPLPQAGDYEIHSHIVVSTSANMNGDRLDDETLCNCVYAYDDDYQTSPDASLMGANIIMNNNDYRLWEFHENTGRPWFGGGSHVGEFEKLRACCGTMSWVDVKAKLNNSNEPHYNNWQSYCVLKMDCSSCDGTYWDIQEGGAVGYQSPE